MNRRRFIITGGLAGLSGCLRLQNQETDITADPTAGQPTVASGTPTASDGGSGPTRSPGAEISGENTANHGNSQQIVIESIDAEWPQFHYDEANTGYHPDTSGPVDNVERAWTFERLTTVPAHRDRDDGDEWSPFIPVISDGSVFISSQDDNIYAIDATTGEVEWRFSADVSTVDPSRKCTPAVANGTVFAEGSGGQFYALDTETGAEQWRRDVVFEVSHIQPTVDGETLYIDGGGFDVAFNIADGSIAWVRDDLGWTHTFTAGESSVYTAQGGPDEFRLFALDKATGETIWTIEGPANSCSIANGNLYTTSTSDPDISEGPPELFCIDPMDGTIRWRTEIPARPDGFHPPTVANGAVFIGTQDTGHLYAYDADTGSRLWTYKTLSGAVKGSPTVADGHVYFGTGWDGKVHCVAADDGTRKWTYPIGEVVYTPTIADNTLFVGDNTGRIHALTEAG